MPVPMRESMTGEPYAGEPHVRFGGRGGPEEAIPTPIKILASLEYHLCARASYADNRPQGLLPL